MKSSAARLSETVIEDFRIQDQQEISKLGWAIQVQGSVLEDSGIEDRIKWEKKAASGRFSKFGPGENKVFGKPYLYCLFYALIKFYRSNSESFWTNLN